MKGSLSATIANLLGSVRTSEGEPLFKGRQVYRTSRLPSLQCELVASEVIRFTTTSNLQLLTEVIRPPLRILCNNAGWLLTISSILTPLDV